MAIGLGVIGMNPTNMGSTATLLKDVPDLKYELRGMCAKRADVLENYAAEIGVDFGRPTIKRWFLVMTLMWLQSIHPITFTPSTVPLQLKPGSTLSARNRW